MIRLTAIALMMLANLTSFSALAQSYAIRVQFNTNLRAEASLDSQVIESAPAGSVLQVLEHSGRWLKISRSGNVLWMADWVSYSRVEDTAPVQPQPTSNVPAQVDNCCFVDRQCNTAADWENGYWAFQNGQCAAPAPSQPQTSAQPVSNVPAQVDNCCFVDRQCHTEADWADGFYAYQNGQCAAPAPTQPQSPAQPVSSIPAGVDNCCKVDMECQTDADWTNGYYAYLNNQCGVPEGIDNCCRAGWHCETEQDWQHGWSAYKYFKCSDEIPMRIKGSSTFVNLVREAYNRLKRTSPRLYLYGITGFDAIREAPADDDTGYFDHINTYQQAFGRGSYTDYDVVTVVGGIAHEACHAHQLADGTATSGWRNELPCMQKELESYRAVDPTDRYGFIAWAQDIVDNIRNPDYWWWE
ncbi:MAG: SH3 domain-containing protein [Chloroflexota bacterium]|nr:SH3 domain-containing protein [Chloroflexota bacterium]